jgi:hypothetical protein
MHLFSLCYQASDVGKAQKFMAAAVFLLPLNWQVKKPYPGGTGIQ